MEKLLEQEAMMEEDQKVRDVLTDPCPAFQNGNGGDQKTRQSLTRFMISYIRFRQRNTHLNAAALALIFIVQGDKRYPSTFVCFMTNVSTVFLLL